MSQGHECVSSLSHRRACSVREQHPARAAAQLARWYKSTGTRFSDLFFARRCTRTLRCPHDLIVDIQRHVSLIWIVIVLTRVTSSQRHNMPPGVAMVPCDADITRWASSSCSSCKCSVLDWVESINTLHSARTSVAEGPMRWYCA
jgi:hypothetical protein